MAEETERVPQWIRESKPQPTDVMARGIVNDLLGAGREPNGAMQLLEARLGAWREAIVGETLRESRVAGAGPSAGTPESQQKAFDADQRKGVAGADTPTEPERRFYCPLCGRYRFQTRAMSRAGIPTNCPNDGAALVERVDSVLPATPKEKAPGTGKEK